MFYSAAWRSPIRLAGGRDAALITSLATLLEAASFFLVDLWLFSTHEAFDSVFTMDAPDSDFDIKLQKISGDLIADLDRALTTSLRKPDGHGGTQVRSFVRAREIFKSTTMVVFPSVHL